MLTTQKGQSTRRRISLTRELTRRIMLTLTRTLKREC